MKTIAQLLGLLLVAALAVGIENGLRTGTLAPYLVVGAVLATPVLLVALLVQGRRRP